MAGLTVGGWWRWSGGGDSGGDGSGDGGGDGWGGGDGDSDRALKRRRWPGGGSDGGGGSSRLYRNSNPLLWTTTLDERELRTICDFYIFFQLVVVTRGRNLQEQMLVRESCIFMHEMCLGMIHLCFYIIQLAVGT